MAEFHLYNILVIKNINRQVQLLGINTLDKKRIVNVYNFSVYKRFLSKKIYLDFDTYIQSNAMASYNYDTAISCLGKSSFNFDTKLIMPDLIIHNISINKYLASEIQSFGITTLDTMSKLCVPSGITTLDANHRIISYNIIACYKFPSKALHLDFDTKLKNNKLVHLNVDTEFDLRFEKLSINFDTLLLNYSILYNEEDIPEDMETQGNRGVRKVSNKITADGFACIMTDKNTMAWEDIPVGTVYVDPKNGLMEVKVAGAKGWRKYFYNDYTDSNSREIDALKQTINNLENTVATMQLLLQNKK